MPEMPDVIPGGAVESDWGNQIRSRTVQRYASVAVRTASNPSPQDGDLSYLADSGTIEYWDGAAWILLVNPGTDLPYLPIGGGTLTGDLFISGGLKLDAGNPQISDDGGTRRLGLFTTFSVYSHTNSFLRFRVGADDTTGYLMRLYDRGGLETVLHEWEDDQYLAPGGGDEASPGLSWINDTDTGLYRSGTNQVGITAAGSKVLHCGINGLFIAEIASSGQAGNMYHQSSDGRVFRSTALMAVLGDEADDLSARQTRLQGSDPADLVAIIEHLLDRIEALEVHHP